MDYYEAQQLKDREADFIGRPIQEFDAHAGVTDPEKIVRVEFRYGAHPWLAFVGQSGCEYGGAIAFLHFSTNEGQAQLSNNFGMRWVIF